MNRSWEWIIRAAWSRPALAIGLLLGALFVPCPGFAPFAAAATNNKKRKKKQAPPKPPPPKQVGAAGLISVAQHELDVGEFAAAAEYASAAGSKAPILNDYAQYVRAQALYRLKNYRDIDKSVTTIFNFQPLSPLIGPAAAVAVKADLDGDQPKQALELIRKYYDRIPQPQADLLYARCFQANGDLPQAAEYYQRVYYNYPVAGEAADAATTLAGLQPKMGDSYPPVMPEAMLGRADRLIHYHRPAEARIELTAAIPKLGGAQRELAEVRLGEVDYYAGNARPAFDYLKTLDLKDEEADAERLCFLIRCARKENRAADVKPFLDELAQKHPNSSWRLRAMTDVANEARVQNDSATALELYGTCAAVFGRNPEAATCNWRRAYNAYHTKANDAGDLLRGYVEEFPDTEDTSDALYFLGRWYEKQGDLPSARAAYNALESHLPNTYFGILGRERLKTDSLKAVAPSGDKQKFLDSVAWSSRDDSSQFKTTPVAQKRLQRAELLQMTGLNDFAEGELKFGARNDDEQKSGVYAMRLAKYALARNAPDEALHDIKLYAPGYLYLALDQAPLEFWQLAFPIPFRGAIEYFSKNQNLDPFLVAALIRQESDFNIKEVSDAHAYGLMQLIPGTARSMARHFSIRQVSTSDLMTSDLNIQLGTLYLRQLLDKFNGQMEWVLAAYNAGPGRSDLWRTWGPFEETADLIEAIPFHETRLYVQIVERNADIYRRLYAGSTPNLPPYHPKQVSQSTKKRPVHKRTRVS